MEGDDDDSDQNGEAAEAFERARGLPLLSFERRLYRG